MAIELFDLAVAILTVQVGALFGIGGLLWQVSKNGEYARGIDTRLTNVEKRLPIVGL
ncbi:MAG: hypothetical protein P1U69_03175 [Parvibaculaceae bacterium]|nr:hypothetical protein RHODOSMS8_00962 [Rhodobiaceae bacterium]MDF1846181.1 hypothetical protein [Parvibaculaceae bacterium]